MEQQDDDDIMINNVLAGYHNHHPSLPQMIIMNNNNNNSTPSNFELFSNLPSMEVFNSSIVLPAAASSSSGEQFSDHHVLHHRQTHFPDMDFHDDFPRLFMATNNNAPIFNPTAGHLFPSSINGLHNSLDTMMATTTTLEPHLQMSSSSVISKRNNKNRVQMKNCEERKRKRDGEKELQDEGREVVHVRAKRGQATDSHSLAERMRREKINEKLRCLQDLVPGCYKTMGMAVMLDVIINYVRSLQNQIDFLSMKLSAASLFYDFNSSEAEGIETTQGTTAQGMEKLMGESYGGISQFQTAANWPPLHFNINNSTTNNM